MCESLGTHLKPIRIIYKKVINRYFGTYPAFLGTGRAEISINVTRGYAAPPALASAHLNIFGRTVTER
jgi:hypothetical protein